MDFAATAGLTVELVATPSGVEVCRLETGLDLSRGQAALDERFQGAVRLHDNDDLMSPLASGSHRAGPMVVVPCTMATMGSLAAGLSQGLLERAADIALKERRQLVIVPRETPLNRIHIENMLRLKDAGADILPAMPAFYNKPESIEDMVDFIVGRILDLLEIEHTLYRRWPV